VALPLASERRTVTVVFIDIADSTKLARLLDPERFREVLAAFHRMATDVIAGLGGGAEGFIGDAVLGVFGLPLVHDDDALRGIRAALEILEETGRLGERLQLPNLRVRIGVNTGLVALGTAADRTLVIGA
jgi:class 3 adenylate cyclase